MLENSLVDCKSTNMRLVRELDAMRDAYNLSENELTEAKAQLEEKTGLIRSGSIQIASMLNKLHNLGVRN
jgi:hypothetical protein